MLKFGSTHFKGDVDVPLDAEKLPPEVNWIDAIQPTADEIGFLQDKLGIDIPTLERCRRSKPPAGSTPIAAICSCRCR